jgi:type IV pilus assembly protein PilY1
VVEIETGRVIAKFRTGERRADDPRHGDTSAKEPNGLAQPTVVGRPWTEGDGDLIATVAYAGDLFGNLWRFNLTGLSGSGTAAETPVRIFRALRDGRAQPITAPMAVAAHPTGVGTLVLFGTGRHLGLPDDVLDLSVQTFYGIWDKGGTDTVNRSDLLEQQFDQVGIRVVVSGSDTTANTGRTSTREAIDWSIKKGWFLDLPDEGERVVSAPQLRGDRVVFTSLVVNEDVCRAGGVSWLNSVSFTSGSALDESPFDFDLSGTFDSADLLPTSSGTAVAGTSLQLDTGGIYSSPAALVLPGSETLSLVSNSEGDLIQLLESSALRWRVWHQIQ